MELKAMCTLCAAHSAMMMITVNSEDEIIEKRKALEVEIDKIIKIRWDHPDKKEGV